MFIDGVIEHKDKLKQLRELIVHVPGTLSNVRHLKRAFDRVWSVVNS